MSYTLAELGHPRLSPEVLLLIYALKYGGTDQEAPDVRTLARRTGLSRSFVNRHRGRAQRLIDTASERRRRGARTGRMYAALTRRQRRARTGVA